MLSMFLLACGCATPPAGDAMTEEALPDEVSQHDLSLYWVKHAAEYRALSRQAYRLATRDLPAFLEDTAWSALPGQRDAAALPPAIILDVDETVVSNVDFQLNFERPFANWKLDEFSRTTHAVPVEGVKEFVEAARAKDIDVYFVTNRPCEPQPGIDDPCPQRQTTIEDIAEVGIETDSDHVLLSEERGWTREKLTRREHIAKSHRILMLIGDDYGDFVPCVRDEPVGPCTEGATLASRALQLDEYNHYWGHGWYILPNPMHGSWTSVR
jgi:acid phosphatase